VTAFSLGAPRDEKAVGSFFIAQINKGIFLTYAAISGVSTHAVQEHHEVFVPSPGIDTGEESVSSQSN
jgi:hypothetical protein